MHMLFILYFAVCIFMYILSSVTLVVNKDTDKCTKYARAYKTKHMNVVNTQYGCA